MNQSIRVLRHPEDHSGSASPLPGIDVANGLFVMGGNVSLYARMLKKFTDSKLYDELISAIEGGDAAVIQSSAHALKGVAANLSLHPLYEMASAIDADAKSGAVIRRDDARVSDLEQTYQKTLASAQAAAENPELLK